jgi:hypothetical protein
VSCSRVPRQAVAYLSSEAETAAATASVSGFPGLSSVGSPRGSARLSRSCGVDPRCTTPRSRWPSGAGGQPPPGSGEPHSAEMESLSELWCTLRAFPSGVGTQRARGLLEVTSRLKTQVVVALSETLRGEATPRNQGEAKRACRARLSAGSRAPGAKTGPRVNNDLRDSRRRDMAGASVVAGARSWLSWSFGWPGSSPRADAESQAPFGAAVRFH